MDKVRLVEQQEIAPHLYEARLKLKPVVIAVSIALSVSGGLTACHHKHHGSSGAGTLSMSAAGGAAGTTSGYGGDGGSIYLYAGDTDDIIEILTSASGAPDISTLPVMPAFGTNGLSVSADTTLAVTATEPAMGTLYQVAGDCNVYISDGDNDTMTHQATVSGIDIAAGVTLTLQDNTIGKTPVTCLSVVNDISNAGNIVPETEGSGVQLMANSYFGDAGSSVNTSGGAINPDAGVINIYVDTSVYNQGDLSAVGADSSTGNGGIGGAIWVDTSAGGRGGNGTDIWNTGTLNCSGGNSTEATSVGGSGGSWCLLYLDSQNPGTMVSAGQIINRGGDGPAGGGDGGLAKVAAWGNQGSDMYVTAEVHTEGGAVTGTDGDGGSGGNIEFYIEQGGARMALLDIHDLTTAGADGVDGGGDGGDIDLYTDDSDIDHFLNEAMIDTHGGDATSASGTNSAGDGGDFLMWTYGGNGDMENDGAVDTSGGNATSGYGGNGGDIEFYNDGGVGDVINHGALTANGGNGTDGGGDGGYVFLYVYSYNNTTVDVAVENTADVQSLGGNATTGNAGSGGEIEIEVDYGNGYVRNDGDLDNSGGNSTSGSGGNGGSIEVEFEDGYGSATNVATVNGNLTSNGGTGAYGGSGGSIYFYSPGMPNNFGSGTINARGGDGDTDGGSGGYVGMYGAPVTNHKNINVSGGNGTTGAGGYGGNVDMYSDSSTSTSNSGTVTRLGGTGGTTDGADGTFTKDGVVQ
jgi:hypothetical protein